MLKSMSGLLRVVTWNKMPKYVGAFEWFCRRQKLKDYWQERTVYNCPFSLSTIAPWTEFRPFDSFMKELYRVDDVELFLESDMDEGLTLVKKRVSHKGKYDFIKSFDYLWYKRRG